tara:strand:+ start:177 stop:491 length:315 start_codon:yes stop_codon:yes gene_type:complete
MRYSAAIIFIIILNLFSVLTLIYYSNLSSKIENKNEIIITKILKLENQIKINEIEYILHNDYSYLKKMQKIYNEDYDYNLIGEKSISYKDFNNFPNNIFKVSSN